jgi:chromosome segregation ATPase
MDKKIKIFLLILIALSFISSLVAFSLFMSKQKIQQKADFLAQENEKVKEDNDKILKKLQALVQDNKTKQEQLEKISQEMEALVGQRDELQGRFDATRKELDEALQKVNAAQSDQTQAPQPEPTFEEVSKQGASSQADETYWAGILKAKSALEIQLGNIKNKLDETNIKMNEAEKSRSDLDSEVKRLNAEKDDVVRELTYNKKLVDNISLELLREKKDKRSLSDQFSTLKEENFVLSNQLKQTLSLKISLEKKLNDLENKKDDLDSKMTQVNSVLQERISELRDIKKEIESTSLNSSSLNSIIELPAIVVKSEEGGQGNSAKNELRGNVVSVDRKNNFVIVNLGQDQGVNAGRTFKVYRNNSEIGVIEAIKVRRDITACDIKEESSSISVGDEVK